MRPPSFSPKMLLKLIVCFKNSLCLNLFVMKAMLCYISYISKAVQKEIEGKQKDRTFKNLLGTILVDTQPSF